MTTYLVFFFLIVTFLILQHLLFARMQESMSRAFHNISVHQKDLSLNLLEGMQTANRRADNNAQEASKQAYDWAEAERARSPHLMTHGEWLEMDMAEHSFTKRREEVSGFPVPEEEITQWRKTYMKEHFRS